MRLKDYYCIKGRLLNKKKSYFSIKPCMWSTTFEVEMFGVFSQKQITGFEKHLNVPVSLV